MVQPSCLQEVKDMMNTFEFFKELQEKADRGILSPVKYKKIGGVWFYKGRVLLDPTSLCTTIFHDHLAAPRGGHSGYHVLSEGSSSHFGGWE